MQAGIPKLYQHRSRNGGIFLREAFNMLWKQPSISESFIFTRFIIAFTIRSVSWLNESKIAVVQLLIKFTKATFKIGCWSTLRYEIKRCFQRQITTWMRDVFSLLLCVENIHMLVIYTCNFFWYCFILYEILRLPFWLKSSIWYSIDSVVFALTNT